MEGTRSSQEKALLELFKSSVIISSGKTNGDADVIVKKVNDKDNGPKIDIAFYHEEMLQFKRIKFCLLIKENRVYFAQQELAKNLGLNLTGYTMGEQSKIATRLQLPYSSGLSEWFGEYKLHFDKEFGYLPYIEKE